MLLSFRKVFMIFPKRAVYLRQDLIKSREFSDELPPASNMIILSKSIN